MGASKEITDLLEGSAVLECDARQAGYYVVETDQFGRAVRSLESEKDFCRLAIVMHADVERALAGDFHFLRDVVAPWGKGETGAHLMRSAFAIVGSHSVIHWISWT
ncbi:hypothetical protein YTPLAS18_29490 [Nitrospira sp.]|nr:hypothetical protein YTPLAS18_29490 [Nitrospira sp.]